VTATFCIALFTAQHTTYNLLLAERRAAYRYFLTLLEIDIVHSILMSLWVLYHLFTNAMRLKYGKVCWIYLVNDWRNFVPAVY